MGSGGTPLHPGVVYPSTPGWATQLHPFARWVHSEVAHSFTSGCSTPGICHPPPPLYPMGPPQGGLPPSPRVWIIPGGGVGHSFWPLAQVPHLLGLTPFLQLSEIFLDAIDPVMQKLGFCCGKRYAFTPLPLFCYGQSVCMIARDQEYYVYEYSSSQFGVNVTEKYMYCVKCFEALPEEGINLNENPIDPPK